MASTIHLGTDIKWMQAPHTAFCLLMWCTSVACWQSATLQSEGLLVSKPALYVYFPHMTFSYIFASISRTQFTIIWLSYVNPLTASDKFRGNMHGNKKIAKDTRGQMIVFSNSGYPQSLFGLLMIAPKFKCFFLCSTPFLSWSTNTSSAATADWILCNLS